MTLVVRRRRPFLTLGAALVAGSLAWGVSWWVMNEEHGTLLADMARVRGELESARSANATLEGEREQLSRRVAMAERARQVEGQAYARVDEQLAQLQDELLSLKEEVAFYREILSDGTASSNIRIQRFVVEADGADAYLFRLVLTRGIRSDNVASGAVSLMIDGERGGQRLQMDMKDLAPSPVPALAFSFKHFQRLEGRFRIPPGFVPRQVVVLVEADRKGSRPLRETFQWPSMNS